MGGAAGIVKAMQDTTTNNNTVIQNYQHEFDNIMLPGKELSWLAQIRQRGFNEFIAQSFPTRKQEDWKYTRTTAFTEQHFPLNQAPQSIEHKQLSQHTILSELDCHSMVFINGVFNLALSTINDLPETVVLQDLPTALTTNNSELKQQLITNSHATKPSQHGFTALNTALMHNGTCLVIPEQCVVEKPIHVIHIVDHSNHASHIRNVIMLGANSQACVIEHYIGLKNIPYFNNIVTDISLSEHARLSHYKVIQESDAALHIASIRTTQQANSEFDSFSLTLDGRLVRSDTHTLLQAPNSQATLNGLFVAQGTQHIDHHTYIEHAANNTRSNEHYRGILTDKGRGVFNGRVFVKPGATGTDAKQHSNNLLLSRDAEIDTKPQLEIFTDDVKCTHGATVGQLDQDALFYCQARGVSFADAKAMLTFAFASQLLESIEHTAICDGLTKAVLSQLPT